MTEPQKADWIVPFLEEYVSRFGGGDSDSLVASLDAAIRSSYRSFVIGASEHAEETGETTVGLDPPRDVVSYILDHHLPEVFRGKTGPHIEGADQLRQWAGQDLDPLVFLALIAVYAHRRGDREGLRRAWDVFTNDRSPYWLMFKDYKRRHDGGKKSAESRSTELRDAPIVAQARALASSGQSKREIVDSLSQRSGLSTRTIQRILKRRT